ncbi:MAG: helix-turn-helix domain-containing protein [Cellulosilyticaceae bacterium]
MNKGILTGFVPMDNRIARDIISKYGLAECMFYYIILSHKNKDYDSCYPSNSCLMEECKISDRTLKKYLKELTDSGHLKIDSGNVHKASNYYFMKEKNLYTKEEIELIANVKRRKGKTNRSSINRQEIKNNIKEAEPVIENDFDNLMGVIDSNYSGQIKSKYVTKKLKECGYDAGIVYSLFFKLHKDGTFSKLDSKQSYDPEQWDYHRFNVHWKIMLKYIDKYACEKQTLEQVNKQETETDKNMSNIIASLPARVEEEKSDIVHDILDDFFDDDWGDKDTVQKEYSYTTYDNDAPTNDDLMSLEDIKIAKRKRERRF